MSEYVYGVVAAGTKPPSATGVRGAPVQVIAGNGAAALVSDLPNGEVELGREEVLAHNRVLEDVVARDSVLPMRFGVVMSDPDDVRQRLLEARGSELDRQLKRLDKKVELNVRGTYEEEPLMREVLRENPSIAELSASVRRLPDAATYYERIRLGEMVSEAVQRKREVDAGEILGSLRPLAEDVVVNDISHERMVLSASFLVPRARMEEFDQAVARLGEVHAHRMRMKYTGPLPPYSFVELAGGQ